MQRKATKRKSQEFGFIWQIKGAQFKKRDQIEQAIEEKQVYRTWDALSQKQPTNHLVCSGSSLINIYFSAPERHMKALSSHNMWLVNSSGLEEGETWRFSRGRQLFEQLSTGNSRC